MRLSMSCPIYRGRDICVIPFTVTQSFLPKKVFVLMQTFSRKGIARDHFQLSGEFFYSFIFCFTSDLDCMGCFCFCFRDSEHLWVGRF